MPVGSFCYSTGKPKCKVHSQNCRYFGTDRIYLELDSANGSKLIFMDEEIEFSFSNEIRFSGISYLNYKTLKISVNLLNNVY